MWFLVSGVCVCVCVCVGVWVARWCVGNSCLFCQAEQSRAEQSRTEQNRGTEAVCPV